MKKLLSMTLVVLIATAMFAPLAFAQESIIAGVPEAKLRYYAVAVFSVAIAMGIAAFGTGIAMGISIKGATEGVARNPGASGKIITTLIIGLALIESIVIYTLVVALIVLFVNPFGI